MQTLKMKSSRYLVLMLLVIATSAHAIIIRSSVPDSRYIVPDNIFPALVDLPMEGHGALIARRWVVTAAHATLAMRTMRQHDYVTISGRRRDVAEIILYPDYLAVSKEWDMLFAHMRAGDARTWLAHYDSLMGSMHDIALIELRRPVEDVNPVELYRSADEQGRIAEILGKGATGSSSVGEYPNSPHRGELRRAYTRISGARAQWLDYTFDCGSPAPQLEGVIGSGDSGGPVLIEDHGEWKLAGLAHGLDGQMQDVERTRAGTFHAGVCGQRYASSRISYFAEWIDSVMASKKG